MLQEVIDNVHRMLGTIKVSLHVCKHRGMRSWAECGQARGHTLEPSLSRDCLPGTPLRTVCCSLPACASWSLQELTKRGAAGASANGGDQVGLPCDACHSLPPPACRALSALSAGPLPPPLPLSQSLAPSTPHA